MTFLVADQHADDPVIIRSGALGRPITRMRAHEMEVLKEALKGDDDGGIDRWAQDGQIKISRFGSK